MPAGKTKKSAARRTALVVLGMHRSGTSALCGVLSHLGCDLPRTLQAGDIHNPRGYFESVQFFTVNDALMSSAASAWDDWNEINPTWYASPRYEEFANKAADVLDHEYGESGFFVMKDPRICRLLPVWQSALKRRKITPLYVTIHRHPNDVAKSLAAREDWPLGRGLLVWLRNVLDAEAASRGGRRVFVRYEDLLGDWQTTVRQIADGLKIGWPLRLETAAPAISAFLEPDLRRQRASDAPDRSSVFLQGWVADVHAILTRWSASGEAKSDYARLDAIRAAFSEATPLLSALLLGQATSARSHQDLEATKARLAELEQALHAAQAELGSSQSGLSEAQSIATAAQQALTSLRAEHQVLHADVQASHEKRVEMSARIEALETALTDSRGLAADLENRLHHAESAVAQRSQETEDLRAEALARQQEVAARIEALETALTDSRGLAADLENRLHHAESAVAQRSQEADDLRAEVETSLRLLQDSEAAREAALAEVEEKTANNRALLKEFHVDRTGLVEELEKLETALMRSRALEDFNRAQLDEAVQRFDAAERERRAMEQEHLRLSREISELTDRLNSDLAKADNDLTRRITELEHNIHALMNSTSWKVTAPMRRLAWMMGRR